MEHIQHQDIVYNTIHQEGYRYFSQHLPTFSACQDFVQRSMQIFDTGDRPIRIDTKKQECTIISQPWDDIHIVRSSLKTPLLTAIQECYVIYDSLLPSLHKYYPHGIHKITDDVMILFVMDVLNLIDAYTASHNKRSNKKYWHIHYKDTIYSHQNKPLTHITEQTAKDITTTIQEDIKHIHFSTIYDLVAYINRSTIPFRISNQGVMVVDKLKALRINDLNAPCMYSFRHLDQDYTFDNIIRSCIQKRGNNIDEKEFIEENLAKHVKNGQKNTLYIAFIKNLRKLYLAYTGQHLKIRYDDGTDAKFDWETTNISITLNNIVPPPQIPQPMPNTKKYQTKKKILKNHLNDSLTLSIDLRKSLGYSHNFAQRLQQFCLKHIIDTDAPSKTTIGNLAYHRNHLPASTIFNFHKDIHLRYCILALDHVLENYLSDKHTSYKEWTSVSVPSK